MQQDFFGNGERVSEQSDVHDRSLFDRALVGWNLDVAVGLRQARDLTGAFECGKRGAVAKTDRVELMPAGGRHDARAERRADRAGA